MKKRSLLYGFSIVYLNKEGFHSIGRIERQNKKYITLKKTKKEIFPRKVSWENVIDVGEPSLSGEK